MNKKVVLSIVALLVLFATIVSASSHGTYDGHNIVKLKANGKELVVEEVPAINYKGRTMVPIGMLRQTGLDVVWNGEEYSVDIKTEERLSEKIKNINQEIYSKGANNFKLIFDAIGSYATVDLNYSGDIESDQKLMAELSVYTLQIDVEEFWINFFIDGSKASETIILKDDIVKYHDGTYSISQFIETWNITPLLYTGLGLDNYEPSLNTGTTYDIYLYSSDGKTYLGKLTSNVYDSDSIFNEFGDYGSKYSTESIWNEYGSYGSKYSNESAFNDFATSPPIIVDSSGETLGHLTTNPFIDSALSPIGLKEWLEDNGY